MTDYALRSLMGACSSHMTEVWHQDGLVEDFTAHANQIKPHQWVVVREEIHIKGTHTLHHVVM